MTEKKEKQHIVAPPTGDEKPQRHYASPYLDQVEAIQREIKSAAASGREPDLANYHPVDLAGAGVIITSAAEITEREEEIENAKTGLPNQNQGATTNSVIASDNKATGGVPSPDQQGLPKQEEKKVVTVGDVKVNTDSDKNTDGK